MNIVIPYFTQLIVTGLLCASLLAYFRPFLKRILVDLCGTEDRANFWMAFANILMVGLPLLSGVGYIPYSSSVENIVFEAARQVRFNLYIFMVALIGVGIAVFFFALIAPKPQPTTKKETP